MYIPLKTYYTETELYWLELDDKADTRRHDFFILNEKDMQFYLKSINRLLQIDWYDGFGKFTVK